MIQFMSTQLSKDYFITSVYLIEAENTQMSPFISLGTWGKEKERGEEEGPHLLLQLLPANTLLKAKGNGNGCPWRMKCVLLYSPKGRERERGRRGEAVTQAA